jgi:hypothetical protein
MLQVIKKVLRAILYWSLRCLGYTLVILLAGTCVGTLGALVLGPWVRPGSTLGQLACQGAWLGFRYAGIWAIGVSIVICYHQLYQRSR